MANETGTEMTAVWTARAGVAAADVITWAARVEMLLALSRAKAGAPGSTTLYSWIANQARIRAKRGTALARQIAEAAQELDEALSDLARDADRLAAAVAVEEAARAAEWAARAAERAARVG